MSSIVSSFPLRFKHTAGRQILYALFCTQNHVFNVMFEDQV